MAVTIFLKEPYLLNGQLKQYHCHNILFLTKYLHAMSV